MRFKDHERGTALPAVAAVLALLSAGAVTIATTGAVQLRAAAALEDRIRAEAAAEGALAAAAAAIRAGEHAPVLPVDNPVAEAAVHGHSVAVSNHPCDPPPARYLVEDRGGHLRITAVGHGCRNLLVRQAGVWGRF